MQGTAYSNSEEKIVSDNMWHRVGCLPCTGEDDTEVEVQMVERAVGRGVVGDQECYIIVIRDTLVIAIAVVHTASLSVH